MIPFLHCLAHELRFPHTHRSLDRAFRATRRWASLVSHQMVPFVVSYIRLGMASRFRVLHPVTSSVVVRPMESQGSCVAPRHGRFPVLAQLSSTWGWAVTELTDPRQFFSPPCLSGSSFYIRAQHKWSLELFQHWHCQHICDYYFSPSSSWLGE